MARQRTTSEKLTKVKQGLVFTHEGEEWKVDTPLMNDEWLCKDVVGRRFRFPDWFIRKSLGIPLEIR